MHINHANLSSLMVAFSAAFGAGLNQAQPTFGEIASTVPSTTRSNEYGWLGDLPRMREWLGDRVVHGIKSHGYSIRNKPFELTVGVDRDDIEDDNLGIYTPLMSGLGQSAASHPDELVYGLLAAGASTLCYDGQNFFDTDHPVLDEEGVAQSQANWDNNSGSGTPWYIMDCSQVIKPLIFQDRKRPQFVAKTAETDDNVFNAKTFVYGVDSRCNAGFALWQLAYGSRKTLDATNLQAALTALNARTGDYGKKLALRATHLVVPSTLEWKAKELLNTTRLANGADNIMNNALKLHIARHL
jgi:phage major head subunit gpT-like protein